MAVLVCQTLQNTDCKVSSETYSSGLQPGNLSVWFLVNRVECFVPWFSFPLLIFVAWISGSGHGLWSNGESLFELETGLLVAGVALGPSGCLCPNWGLGVG